MDKEKLGAGTNYLEFIKNNKGASDKVFEGLVLLKGVDFIQGIITFRNCIFEKDVSIENCTIRRNLNFENCEFQGHLNIYKGSSDLVQVIGGSYDKITINRFRVNHIYISQVKESFKELSINSIDTSEEGSFIFENLNVEDLKIKDSGLKGKLIFSSLTYNELNINNVIVEKEWNIEKCNGKNSFILRSKFNDSLHFLPECNLDLLSFQSVIFNDRVEIEGSIDSLNIHKADFLEQVLFKHQLFCKVLNLTDCYFKRQISIESHGNIQSLDCSDSNFDGSLILSDTERVNDESGIQLSLGGTIKGNILVFDCLVWLLHIECINLGIIYLDRIRTKLIVLKGFYNLNRLLLAHLRLDGSGDVLIVHDSNIGKTEFMNVDLTTFKEVVIAKSNLSEMQLTNSRFPKTISLQTKNQSLGYELEEYESSYSETYYRDSYRQLKLAMKNQVDIKSMLDFKSKEMNHLRNEIKSFPDKFLLWLNYTSNRHGISWLHGIKFTLVVAFLFYILYAFIENKLYLRSELSMMYIIEHYANFITSFPKLEPDSGIDHSSLSKVVVFLARIFMGYGAYQTIMAFRKYGTK